MLKVKYRLVQLLFFSLLFYSAHLCVVGINDLNAQSETKTLAQELKASEMQQVNQGFFSFFGKKEQSQYR